MKEFTEMGYNLISDYSEGSFDFNVSELFVIDDFLHSIKTLLNKKKNAVIVNNPLDTVISVIYQEKAEQELGFSVKTFYTLEAAIAFVMH